MISRIWFRPLYLALILPINASAQTAHHLAPEGIPTKDLSSLWVRGAVGISFVGPGIIADLAAGTEPIPRLRVGGEFMVFRQWNPFSISQATTASMVALVHHYPAANSGAFVRGGLGLTLALNDRERWAGIVRGGVGHDWPLGPDISIGFSVDVWQSVLGRKIVNGVEKSSNYTLFTIGVGITFR